MFEIGEVLDLAIRLEKNGETTYRKAMTLSPSSELAAMLEWMAAEEAKHGQWFAALKTAVDGGVRNSFLEKMSRQVLDDLVGSQSFSLKEVDFARVAGTDDLVAAFIEFEQDTVLFYEMLAPFIEDDKTRGCLQTIIAEENRHIACLKRFLTGNTKASVLTG